MILGGDMVDMLTFDWAQVLGGAMPKWRHHRYFLSLARLGQLGRLLKLVMCTMWKNFMLCSSLAHTRAVCSCRCTCNKKKEALMSHFALEIRFPCSE